MSAPVLTHTLAPALVVLPGPRAGVADAAGARALCAPDARDILESAPVLMAHAAMTARRLALNAPPRSPRILLDELAAAPEPSREEALAIAETLARADARVAPRR